VRVAVAQRLAQGLHARGVGLVLSWPAAGHPVDGQPVLPDPPADAPHPRAASEPDDVLRGRAESYLLSSAAFWLDVYHVDGLRILTRTLRDRSGLHHPLGNVGQLAVLRALQHQLHRLDGTGQQRLQRSGAALL